MPTNRTEGPTGYEFLFETSWDLVCELDRDGGFLRVNPTFRQVLGYTDEALASERFTSLVHPEDAAPVRELFGSADKGDARLHFDARFRHRDGSYPRCSFSLRRAPGEDVVYGLGYQAGDEPEHERRRRWLLLQQMQATARIGGWEMDCQTKQQYWTEETYRIHEVPLSFAPDFDSGIAFYAPECRAAIGAAWEACVNNGEPYDLELQIITAKGRRIWVRTAGTPVIEGGKVVRVVGAFQDVDVFKRRAIELEEKLAIIEQQRAEIHALSAPIIQVWDGVLALPVVGLLDKARAEEITARMLDAVAGSSAQYAILDLTGVESVDEVTADHMVRILRAIQLLGAQGLVTGIRPAVAQTMTALGAGFAGTRTLSNLREALKVCMQEQAAGGALPAR